MKQLKTYYAKINNMGDLLNEYIIPQVTGREIVHCEKVSEFSVMGIGSCGGAVWAGKEKNIKSLGKDTIKKMSCLGKKEPCAVWGTGFLKDYPSDVKLSLIRKDTQFIALRGNRSKEIVVRSLGYEINPVLCDGGILSSSLLDEKPETKYSVGLIPHYKEIDFMNNNGIIEAFTKKYSDGCVIDLRNNPLEVIKKIAECDAIISCSLHGCVVADSFHIPNIRIKTSSIPGSGFKFDDYFSSYGLDIPALFVQCPSQLPTIKTVKDSYMITYSMVEEKKQQMRECLLEFVNKI